MRFNHDNDGDAPSHMDLTHDFCVESEDYTYDAHMQQMETPSQFSGYIYDEENVGLSDAYVHIYGDAILTDNTTQYLNFNIYTDESG